MKLLSTDLNEEYIRRRGLKIREKQSSVEGGRKRLSRRKIEKRKVCLSKCFSNEILHFS